jgi:uncharacterized membrane protein (Fun14 family)
MNEQEAGQENYYRDIPVKDIEPTTYGDIPLSYLEMGTTFIIGMAIGFILKKSFKILLFILGLSLIIIFFMESQGIFTINDKLLEENISNGSRYLDYLISLLKERITSFQSGISITSGFIIGLKFG